MSPQFLLPFSDDNKLNALWKQLPASARHQLINLYSELVPRMIRAASEENHRVQESTRTAVKDHQPAP
jgi:hypothetical protein